MPALGIEQQPPCKDVGVRIKTYAKSRQSQRVIGSYRAPFAGKVAVVNYTALAGAMIGNQSTVALA
jgi:hypothetical protein